MPPRRPDTTASDPARPPLGAQLPLVSLLLPGLGGEWTAAPEADLVVVEPSGERRAARRPDAGHGGVPIRIGVLLRGLDGPCTAADLAAVMPLAPEIALLRGARGAHDVDHLAVKLAVAEAEHDRPAGSVAIVAVIDDGASVAALPGLAAAETARLVGIAYDPASLQANLGCGPDAEVLAFARSSVILTAASIGVPAIWIEPDGRAKELRERLVAAKREGFAATLVDRAGAVAVARAVFSPARSDV